MQRASGYQDRQAVAIPGGRSSEVVTESGCGEGDQFHQSSSRWRSFLNDLRRFAAIAVTAAGNAYGLAGAVSTSSLWTGSQGAGEPTKSQKTSAGPWRSIRVPATRRPKNDA